MLLLLFVAFILFGFWVSYDSLREWSITKDTRLAIIGFSCLLAVVCSLVVIIVEYLSWTLSIKRYRLIRL